MKVETLRKAVALESRLNVIDKYLDYLIDNYNYRVEIIVSGFRDDRIELQKKEKEKIIAMLQEEREILLKQLEEL